MTSTRTLFDPQRYPVYVRAAGRHAARAHDLAAAGDFARAADVLLDVDAIASELHADDALSGDGCDGAQAWE